MLFVLLVPGLPAHAQDIGELLGGTSEAPATQTVPERRIDTESSPADDADIRRRLSGIFAELEGLETIDVSVSNGVVTLSGTADSVTVVDQALALAEQVSDVVEVVDRTSVDNSVKRRLGFTLDRWETNARTALMALPTLLVALLVFILFWWLARRLSAQRHWFRRLTPNGFIAELFAGIARILVTLIGVVLALSLLDATSIIGTVLGAAGIVGLAVGFAVRDTVENYIASILLSLRQPFDARDLVAINDNEGRVARLTSRATVLISIDGNHIRIPNAEVYKAIIVNYTRNPQRRIAFTVGVDTDLALQPAQRLATRVVNQVPGVLNEPPVMVVIEALGDSSVTLCIYFWIDQRHSDWQKVRSEAIRLVKRAYDDAGIVMPEPVYRLRLNAAQLDRLTGMGNAAVQELDGERTDPGRAEGRPGEVESVDSADPADTSTDNSVEATLEKEIGAGDGANLLDARGVKE